MIYTVLKLVQSILNDMDSDEVDSISDTTESLQVASILQDVYYECCVDLNIPSHESIIQLVASGDVTKPCLMTVPAAHVNKINWIKYDNKLSAETYVNYVDICWKPFVNFLMDQQALRNDASGVGQQIITPTNSQGGVFKVQYRTDKMPQFWTSPDDHTIVFDSFLNTEDSTLQTSKTMCSAHIYPDFVQNDTFVPIMEPAQFPYFLNKAKVRAFATLKQITNQDAAAEARRQKIVQQRSEKTLTTQPAIFSAASRFGRK